MMTRNYKYRISILLASILFLAMSTAEGQTINWAKGSTEYDYGSLYGGYYIDAQTTATAIDNNKNLITTGFYESCSIQFGSVHLYGAVPSGNTFIVKYDSSGNVLWAFGSTGSGAYSTSIATDKWGNIIVAGTLMPGSTVGFGSDTAYHTRHGFTNYFLFKLDPAGNVLWHKTGNGLGFGGSGTYNVKTDHNGNIYFCGAYGTKSISFGSYILTNVAPSYTSIFMGDTAYRTDIFLTKYDPSGNVIWAQTAGGAEDDFSGPLALDGVGNVCITGTYNSPSITFGGSTLTNSFGTSGSGFNPNVYLVKFNPSGGVVWANNISATRAAGGGSIITDRDNNVYLTGSFQDTLSIGGTTIVSDSAGHTNGFFAQFNAAGSFTSAFKYGGNINAFISSLAYGSITGNIYMGGSFSQRGSLSIGGTLINQLDTFAHGSTSFILAYNQSGTFSEIGNCYVGFPNAYDYPMIAVDADERLYMSGTFHSPIHLPTGDSLINTSNSSVYSMRFNNCSAFPPNTAVKDPNRPVEVNLSPNPANETLTVSYSGPATDKASIEVFDLTGRLSRSSELTGNTTHVSLTGLVSGTYICRISINQFVTMKKIVVY